MTFTIVLLLVVGAAIIAHGVSQCIWMARTPVDNDPGNRVVWICAAALLVCDTILFVLVVVAILYSLGVVHGG